MDARNAFLKEIEQRKLSLVRINESNLNRGDTFQHTCICNELKGIAYVMDKLQKYGL
jgi:hypothetical protein